MTIEAAEPEVMWTILLFYHSREREKRKKNTYPALYIWQLQWKYANMNLLYLYNIEKEVIFLRMSCSDENSDTISLWLCLLPPQWVKSRVCGHSRWFRLSTRLSHRGRMTFYCSFTRNLQHGCNTNLKSWNNFLPFLYKNKSSLHVFQRMHN